MRFALDGGKPMPVWRGLAESTARSEVDRLWEVQRLRDALAESIRLLAELGYSADAYRGSSLPELERDPWRRVLQIWEVAGVRIPFHVRMCFTGGDVEDAREYSTVQEAVEDAVAEVEFGELHPESIEIDGVRVLDRSEILRLWEERHDPD